MNSPIKHQIPPRERLIFAMDVADAATARQLVRELGDSVLFYKLGLEFFLSGSYFELASELRAAGKKVFADLKLFDIPATVAALQRIGPRYVMPGHCTGWSATHHLARALPEAFVPNSVGTALLL